MTDTCGRLAPQENPDLCQATPLGLSRSRLPGRWCGRPARETGNATVRPLTVFALILLAAPVQFAAAQTALSVSSGVGTRGGTVLLPISFSTPSPSVVAGLQWTLTYSTTDFESVSVTAGPAATAAGKSAFCSNTPGIITCLIVGINTQTIAGGVVATVVLKVSPTTSSTSSLIHTTAPMGANTDGASIAVSGTSALLSILPPPVLSALACSPASIATPGASSCWVTFTAPAPAGGTSVAVSSDYVALTVPSTVTVSAGATSVFFTVTAAAVASNTAASVTASLGGVSCSFSIALVAPAVSCTPTCPIPVAVFRGTDGTIQALEVDSLSLLSESGSVVGDPGTAQNAAGDTFVAARDPQNGVSINVYLLASHSWKGWVSAGGSSLGTPGVAVTPDGTAWVAIRESAGNFRMRSYRTDTGFGAWIDLGGAFSSDPAIAVATDGSIYVVGAGLTPNQGTISSGRYVPGAGFGGWVVGTSAAAGRPAAAAGSDGAVYVAIRYAGGSYGMSRLVGNTWGQWYAVASKALSTDPQLAATGGRIYVAALDGQSRVWVSAFQEGSANGWYAWGDTYGWLNTVAIAALRGDFYVVGKDANTDLWWYRSGVGWIPYGNRGAAASNIAVAPVSDFPIALVVPPALSAMTCSPASITSGSTATCTVWLSAPAPVGGLSISLSSNSAALTVPSSVTVAAGSTTGIFTTTAGTVSSSTNVTVTASRASASKTATITDQPLVQPSALACSPASIATPGASSCWVTFTAPAPAGGTSVAVSSDYVALTVPSTVTVSAGATSVFFTVTAAAVASNTAASVTASLGGVSCSFSIALVAPAVSCTPTCPIPVAVFRGTDGTIQALEVDSLSLLSESGSVVGDPGTAQNAAGDTFVAARDPQNGVSINVYLLASHSWKGWVSAGGSSLGTPGVAVTPDGTAWVAIRESAGNFRMRSYRTDTGFGAWIDLGGAFSSDPAIAVATDGSIYVVGAGLTPNQGTISSGRYVPGAGFGGWVVGTSAAAGRPAAAAGSDGAVYVAIRYAGGSYGMSRLVGNTWGQWYAVASKALSTDPQLAATGGRIYVAALDGQSRVWVSAFQEGSANGWYAWGDTYGWLNTVAIAALRGDFYVVGKDANTDLWWYRSGVGWIPYGNRGAAASNIAVAPW